MTAFVSQTALEVLEASGSARVSQAALETLHNDAVFQIRTSQAVAEVLHDDTVFEVRASQTVLEVLCSLQGFVGYVSIASGRG